MRNKQDLRGLKQGLVRSNTRNVYKTDQDDLLVSGNENVQAIAEAIERRRIELGKTSGFERLYAKVTKLYFGGMAQHLSQSRGTSVKCRIIPTFPHYGAGICPASRLVAGEGCAM
jgi:hypothetical protein